MVEESGVILEVGVFVGAFDGDGEEDFVMGEGVVVSSSSLERSTKSCLSGIMERINQEKDEKQSQNDKTDFGRKRL
ncbi:hypothetical protein Tco_0018529 [Tanacetum coccineum]